MGFEHLLGLHTGLRREPLPVVDIDPLIAQALGARARRVLLSAETIQKQLRRHADLPISTYRCAEPCLRRGSYRQDSPRSAVILYTDRNIVRAHFRACIKATQAGHERYLVPFLMMRERDLRRELRKPYPVLRSGP